MSARDYTPRPKTYTPPKAKSPLKKHRDDDTGKLRKKLDDVFSKYIRGLSRKCFTCGLPASQCGHFMKRGNDATRWDENNARPQCWNCNVQLEGNVDVFRKRLIDEIGLEEVAAIEVMARDVRKFSAPELQELIDKYSQKKKAA